MSGHKRELIRLVKGPDRVVRVDLGGGEPGRGAYVHRTEACVREAFRRSSVTGALRTRLDPEKAARLMDDVLNAVGVRP
jgi:uncharacterized protein